MIKQLNVEQNTLTKLQWTRAEVLGEMGLRSRSTLNAYCNYLKIPRWIRYFDERQHNQLMELRVWIKRGNAISDYACESVKQDCA